MNDIDLIEGTPAHTARVRALNDAFRQTLIGGRIVITAGLCAAGSTTVQAILEAVSKFDAFTRDNDPWDEHDCAAVTVLGIDVLWKIDYYDSQMSFHSPDAADPDVTVRVLTIMRVDEY